MAWLKKRRGKAAEEILAEAEGPDRWPEPPAPQEDEIEAPGAPEAEAPATGAAAPAPDAEDDEEEAATADKGDFFDLEEVSAVAAWQAPGVTIPRKEPINLKPALYILATALVIAGVVWGIIWIWPSSSVNTPDVIGKTLTDAMGTAQDGSMKPSVSRWQYSQKHSDGVVLAQSPVPGTKVPKGTAMQLAVSKGPRPQASQPTAPAPSQKPDASGSISGKTVCIDAGHQAIAPTVLEEWRDPGMTVKTIEELEAAGTASGNKENVITLDVAMKLKNLLEKDGVKVVMTRESGDVDLSSELRAEIANNGNADIAVHVHTGNSNDAAVRGPTVLYPERNQWTADFYAKSKTAAFYTEQELVKSCGVGDDKIQPDDQLVAFNWSKVPTIQANVAYLSNEEDDRALTSEDYRWKIAWGLRNGLVQYFSNL